MKILLEAGAHKSVLDLAKMTPLHHACVHASNASEACVQLLLGEEGEEQEWVNARDISGCTPLLYCLNNKNRTLEKVCPPSPRRPSGSPPAPHKGYHKTQW